MTRARSRRSGDDISPARLDREAPANWPVAAGSWPPLDAAGQQESFWLWVWDDNASSGLMTRVLVLTDRTSGRLGSREPDVYGDQDLSSAARDAHRGRRRGHEIDLRQTDDEAELIGWLHEAVDEASPVILNPAAFTHYSYALRDAAALSRRRACR